MTFHETQDQKNIPVIKAGKVIGYVTPRTTSIGAAKLAKAAKATWSTRAIPDRSYSPGWVAE